MIFQPSSMAKTSPSRLPPRLLVASVQSLLHQQSLMIDIRVLATTGIQKCVELCHDAGFFYPRKRGGTVGCVGKLAHFLSTFCSLCSLSRLKIPQPPAFFFFFPLSPLRTQCFWQICETLQSEPYFRILREGQRFHTLFRLDLQTCLT